MNYELKTQNSTFKIRKSWVYAWLFVFSSACVDPAYVGCTADSIIIGLHKEKFLNWDGSPTATGVALATGHGGELYALFDTPPRLIVWKADNMTAAEFGDVSGWVRAPSDLVSDGGMQLLVVDPWLEHIVRLNHRLQLLPPVLPDVGGKDFEPVSICRITDGTLFVINRADDDVWRINRDGRTVPLGWSPMRSGWLDKPSRIDYAASIGKVLILDEGGVKLASPYGAPDLLIKTNLTRPVGIGVNHDEAWVVGDGLSCISLTGRTQTFFVPVDSLVAWGVYPAVDVALSGDQRLYLLPENGGRVLVMKVERSVEGHP